MLDHLKRLLGQAQTETRADQKYVPAPGPEKDLRVLGYPLHQPEDWSERLLDSLETLANQRRSFRTYLDLCLRCGLCARACPVYAASGDPLDMPAARGELARAIYRRYFSTVYSHLPGRLSEGRDPDAQTLSLWFTYFYRCLTCRRCAVFCPSGIDTSEITLTCREIMAKIGLISHYPGELAALTAETGNCLGLPAEEWGRACFRLEQQVFTQTGVAVRFPVDEAQAEVLLIPSILDYHFHPGTLIGYAKMFHAAGISWTTTTLAPGAENHGFFLGYPALEKGCRRIVEAVSGLRPKRLVWGESGHGFRVGRNFLDHFTPPEFPAAYPPLHICQVAGDLFLQGAFQGKIDPEVNQGIIATYHDPCQIARGAGLFSAPRVLLRAAVEEFYEMPAKTIREWTLCCGSGGGLIGDDARDLRLAAGKPRAEAFSACGANHLATICATCKSVLPGVLLAHLGREIPVSGVMDLFGRALTPHPLSPDRAQDLDQHPVGSSMTVEP